MKMVYGIYAIQCRLLLGRALLTFLRRHSPECAFLRFIGQAIPRKASRSLGVGLRAPAIFLAGRSQ